ncbi:MAG: SGNH/GDSL hydrolase family protein [Candidatus Omnitrophica bacterium]|nr:SGNH/GDSL hydrolase family protein [Candidatus Omnitrophota bacterium]
MKKKRYFVFFSLMIAVSIFSCIFGMGILEGYLRFTQRYRLNTFYWKELPGKSNSRLYRNASDLLVGWEHDPGGATKINSLGFPDVPRTIKKDDQTFRIVVLGDSVTETGEYVGFLEHALNTSGLGKKFEVWNCSCGGYQAVNYYGLLREKVLGFNPDMVILGFCLNDFNPAPIIFKDSSSGRLKGLGTQLQGIPTYYGFFVNSFLFLNSYAYRFLVITTQKILRGRKAMAENKPGEVALWALTHIRDLTQRKNIPLMGVIIPYLKNRYSSAEEEEYATMRHLLEETGIRYLDLHGDFTDRDEPSLRRSPQDGIHHSEAGHRVIARILHTYLLQDLSWWFTRN